GNNAKVYGSASGQAQQEEPVVDRGSGVGAIIGLSAAGGKLGRAGVGVGSQNSSHTR
ncbi:hypothetical protein Tco_1413981, partial [Tanacetum coccineum]